MTSSAPAAPRVLDARDDPFAVAVGPDQVGFRRRLLTLQCDVDIAAPRRSGATMLGAHTGRSPVGALARPSVPHVYFLEVAVSAEHRGTGVGRALMEEVIKRAEARSLPVHLDPMTEENVAFYEHLGFRADRRLELAPTGASSGFADANRLDLDRPTLHNIAFG